MGFIGGLIGGVIGAIIWGVLSYVTGWRFGVCAWLVGLLVGLGWGIGEKGRVKGSHAFVAAGLAVIAVLAGMLLSVTLRFNKHESQTLAEIGEAEALDAMKSEILEQKMAAGAALSWPEGMDDEESEGEVFPQEVERAAAIRWDQLSAPEQAAYVDGVREQAASEMSEYRGLAIGLGFIFNFGLFGIVWLGFAAVTAYKAVGFVKPPQQAEMVTLDANSAPMVNAEDAAAGSGGAMSFPMAGAEPPAVRPNEPPMVIKRSEAA